MDEAAIQSEIGGFNTHVSPLNALNLLSVHTAMMTTTTPAIMMYVVVFELLAGVVVFGLAV